MMQRTPRKALKSKPFNFSSGPACLPESVIQQVKNDLPDWQGGMSVMEVSHRSRPFMALLEKTEQQLRELLSVPDEFSILFMHGGAKMQFSAVGLNLLHHQEAVNMLLTGHWSKVAHQELQKFNPNCHVVSDSSINDFCDIAEYSSKDFDERAKHLYYTDNETIHGIEFHNSPELSHGLIADMTSSILTKAIDFQQHDCIFASAQKNLGIAGVTCAIVRKSLLGKAHPLTPSVLDYQLCEESSSLYNTPPVFALYVLSLILDWVTASGGIPYFQVKAQKLASALYSAIDNSALYQNKVSSKARSNINIPFTLPSEDLEQTFLSQAKEAGLLNLKGHRAVGGIRASIYNAMPEEGVKALIMFMEEFERAHSA